MDAGDTPLGFAAVPTEKRQRQKEGHQARKQAALVQARRQARKRRLITLSVLVIGFLAIMLVISLVSDGDDDGTDVTAGDDTSTTTDTTTTTTPASTTPTSAKPAIPEPGGDERVTELVIEDLHEGDGPVIEVGDTIEAHYLGATYADGEQFESSWDSGRTFEAQVAEGRLIEGWVEGIPGMKVGGRRMLIIPAEMAYGDEGDPAGDLVFIVDVYAVK